MNILVLRNPDFMPSQSMPRFSRMIVDGMSKRGHHVRSITAKARFTRMGSSRMSRKWLGYIDRLILFPAELRKERTGLSSDSIVVSVDQALGPWMKRFRGVPRVTHCHDLLSVRASLGEFEHVRISRSGKLLNAYVRRSLNDCPNFISVSQATHTDVERFFPKAHGTSQVVYNGLNSSFRVGSAAEARQSLGGQLGTGLRDGYLLHVGGNQWYKNRAGVIEIYAAWRRSSQRPLPLVMVGPTPPKALLDAAQQRGLARDIHFRSDLTSDQLVMAYQGATMLLFPSIAEGFGWPIAEAMACGCPVVTTGVPPMTEVGGNLVHYISLMPAPHSQISHWAAESAAVVEKVARLTTAERARLIEAAPAVAKRFDPDKALDEIEGIYEQILAKHSSK
jgi:glycosyltransferase involved in cell wall biosynthesis